MTDIRGRIRESADGLKKRPDSQMRSDAEQQSEEHLKQTAEQHKAKKENK